MIADKMQIENEKNRPHRTVRGVRKAQHAPTLHQVIEATLLTVALLAVMM